MGQFTNGVLVGLGISLLFTPKKGDEMRSLVTERFNALRGTYPENEQVKQQVEEMARNVQDTQDLTNRAAQMGSALQNNLNNVAQETGADVTSKRPAGTSGRSNQTGNSGL